VHHSDTAIDSHGALSATADCSSTDLLDFQSTTEHYDKLETHLNDQEYQSTSSASRGSTLIDGPSFFMADLLQI
jgi:hypothetical protein